MSVRSQSGFALLMVVAGLVTMVLFLGMGLTALLGGVDDESGRERRQVALRLAMRDFSAMAQRANQVFSATSSCPAGTTRAPTAASPFCWPNAGASNFNCIRYPLATSSSSSLLCLTGTTGALQLQARDERSLPRRLFDSGKKWVAKQGRDFILKLSPVAFAQMYENHLPVLPAYAGDNLTDTGGTMTCTATATTNCKRCGTNVQCVTLRVCLDGAGCTTDQWASQRIGIMPR